MPGCLFDHLYKKTNNIIPSEVFNAHLTKAGHFRAISKVTHQSNKPIGDVSGVSGVNEYGGITYNLRLSERRAQTVSNELMNKGVSPGRLVARGFGKTQPIASNNTAAGKALNRRVEIHIVGQR